MRGKSDQVETYHNNYPFICHFKFSIILLIPYVNLNHLCMTLIRITKGTTMAVFWYALLIFLVHPVAAFAYQSREKGACRDNREEFGFSLLGHDYESMYADNFGRCFFVCSSGEKCQSATFLWETKECKLNNETKKSRPEAFVKHPAATYMTNPYRGKITLFLAGN